MNPRSRDPEAWPADADTRFDDSRDGELEQQFQDDDDDGDDRRRAFDGDPDSEARPALAD